ncbi:MAG: hypothetical protein QF728_09305, partial [Arenicellales bacterium]|nr:hypothetical protein [Arenicellales bacterium]
HNKASDMFHFLDNINNLADTNKIFSEGVSSIMKFNPFDFQKFYETNVSSNNQPEEKNSKNTSQNIDDLVSQINKLKDQVEEIKKKDN